MSSSPSIPSSPSGIATRLSPSVSEGERPLYAKPNGPKKIIDLINQKAENNEKWFSFEYFPPRTDAGVTNLYNRIESMSLTEPLFLDITWGAGGTTSGLTLELAATMQQSFGPEVMMHLTCTNMPRDSILQALTTAKECGVRNILALRGDPPHGQDTFTVVEDGFAYAVDLVKFIRQEFGDWFGIGVAGYPESHIESTNAEDDMKYLKEKVDAGADFIVTQLFYDVDLFLNWVVKCRAAGINVPILPGIMPIQSFAGFKRMTGFCKTFIPQHITDALEPICNDDAAVRKYGVQLATTMCKQLFEAGIPGVHMYTLNLHQSSIEILENLQLIERLSERKKLPWKQSQWSSRHKSEFVRPIFWSNRPESYLSRSQVWDFPNGRFGNSQSPAYGELSGYFMCPPRHGTPKERRALWGEAPATPEDLGAVFADFVQNKITRLPWCDTALSLESQQLIEQLVAINNKGFFTINSQPAVNAAPSDHPAFGWGPGNGYVYQKAYLEFFVSPENFAKFQRVVKEQYPNLSYCALTHNTGLDNMVTNFDAQQNPVNAVTWGVFANSEVLQPTVMDTKSFEVWKDEAFTLFLTMWQSIYEQGSTSWELLQNVHDNYILVNVVDNDFIKGNLFSLFEQL